MTLSFVIHRFTMKHSRARIYGQTTTETMYLFVLTHPGKIALKKHGGATYQYPRKQLLFIQQAVLGFYIFIYLTHLFLMLKFLQSGLIKKDSVMYWQIWIRLPATGRNGLCPAAGL